MQVNVWQTRQVQQFQFNKTAAFWIIVVHDTNMFLLYMNIFFLNFSRFTDRVS